MPHLPWHKEYPGLLSRGFDLQGGSNPNYRGVREPDYFDPETIRREAPMSAPAGYVPMDERAIGPQLPPMQAGASPRQTGFSGPIEWDMMDMDPTAGVQNELVEPLREMEPGRQLNWDALTEAGMDMGGFSSPFSSPSTNLGFAGSAIQNNPSPYEWEDWQKKQRQGMGIYGGRNA